MSRPLRTLVVDDEPAARRLLVGLLTEQPDVEIAGTCRHGHEAVQWLQSHSVDLLFLDVRMPGMDGFEVLDALGEPPTAVVFVTAYDEFAIRAFEAEAWDYLLKPYDDERLQQTLDRVRRRLQREYGNAPDEPATPPMERIAVPKGRGRVTLDLRDVLWIQAEGNYARFHVADGSYLARHTLSGLEERLDPQRFVRVHRSAIVNLRHIVRLDPVGHGDVRLALVHGGTVTLSRRFRRHFEQAMELLS